MKPFLFIIWSCCVFLQAPKGNPTEGNGLDAYKPGTSFSPSLGLTLVKKNGVEMECKKTLHLTLAGSHFDAGAAFYFYKGRLMLLRIFLPDAAKAQALRNYLKSKYGTGISEKDPNGEDFDEYSHDYWKRAGITIAISTKKKGGSGEAYFTHDALQNAASVDPSIEHPAQ
jgi:hypothetical protein